MTLPPTDETLSEAAVRVDGDWPNAHADWWFITNGWTEWLASRFWDQRL